MGNIFKVTMLKTPMPNLTKDAEFFPGMPNWGLSFMINEEMAPTGRTPGSLAWAGLANTYFWIKPEQRHRRRLHDPGAWTRRRCPCSSPSRGRYQSLG